MTRGPARRRAWRRRAWWWWPAATTNEPVMLRESGPSSTPQRQKESQAPVVTGPPAFAGDDRFYSWHRGLTSTRVSLAEPIADAALPEVFARWFAQRGWAPRAHQLELLAKARAG